jgi:hypothetical protein
MNAQLGQDWLSFAKDTYATAQERQGPIDELAQKVAQQQFDTSVKQDQRADEAYDRYKNTFEPLQDQFIQEAQDYDSSEAQAAAAAKARAGVESAAASERASTNRSLTAMGVNPNSGRFAGINRAADLGTAVAAAGAENTARDNLKTTALGLKAGAINMGNGLPAQAGQAVGLGLNAGTGAANVTNAANGQFLAGTGVMNQGFQGAMAGYTNEANILQNQYNSQLKAYQLDSQNNAGMLSGIGSIIGLGFAAPQSGSLFGSILSSKKLKKDKRKSGGHLKAVKSMPIEKWRYKDGVADGGAAEHVGTYAEDFKKATGHGDGQSIPVGDAIGVTMGAVKELSNKVDRLHKHVVGLGSRNVTKKAA